MIEIKERTLQKIEKYQKEIKTLEKQVEILDSIVKQSSFTKASSLQNEQKSESDRDHTGEPIPITRGDQGPVIANAYITPEQVSIILDETVSIDANTPPLQTFFLDRIIGEMKQKDGTEIDKGTISGESVIDCIINKNGSSIKEIIVRNYRHKERAEQIISTAGWSLNRMLDNIK